MIAAILAGGKSRRMGTPKGLLEIDGLPLILHHLQELIEANFGSVYLIFGAGAEDYLNRLGQMVPSPNHSDYSKELDIHSLRRQFENVNIGLEPKRCLILLNSHFESGMFSSVRLACKTAVHNDEPLLILPVDTPPPGAAFYSLFLGGIKVKHWMVAKPVYENETGHPVLLSSKMVELLSSESSLEDRLDHWINKLEKDQIQKVPVEHPGILQNLNTQSEFQDFLTKSLLDS